MARKTKKIPVRDEFLIVTNGKRSEKDYFEILRSKIKSIYKIKVTQSQLQEKTMLVSHFPTPLSKYG